MSKQVNILFSDAQYDNLRKVAFHSRTSVAAIVRVLATSPSPSHAEKIKHEVVLQDEDLGTLESTPRPRTRRGQMSPNLDAD